MSSTLTAKQRRFVQEYVHDFNGQASACRAGYSATSARFTAARLLSKPAVEAALREALAAQRQRLELSADAVIHELVRIGLADLGQAFDAQGRFLALHEMPEDVRRALAGVEAEELFEGRGENRQRVGTLRKIRLADKLRALELLGKHLRLWVDRVEAEVIGEPLSDEERARRVAAILARAQARRDGGDGRR